MASPILYTAASGDYITREVTGRSAAYLVWRHQGTHAVKVGTYGTGLPDAYTRAKAKADEDADILGAVAQHPVCGRLTFERVYQDRRWYYRIAPNGGGMTDATHARETVAYWRGKGWL